MSMLHLQAQGLHEQLSSCALRMMRSRKLFLDVLIHCKNSFFATLLGFLVILNYFLVSNSICLFG